MTLGNPATQGTPAIKTILKPPTTLLMGPPGSGKTTALTTYIEAGLKLAILFTDPGGEESFIAAMERKKLPFRRPKK